MTDGELASRPAQEDANLLHNQVLEKYYKEIRGEQKAVVPKSLASALAWLR